MLQRAFNHVGCKAAHVGAMTPEGLAPFGPIGAALWATRQRPRALALEALLDSFTDDATGLYAELDAIDRALARFQSAGLEVYLVCYTQLDLAPCLARGHHLTQA